VTTSIDRRPVSVGFVSTYPPTACGLASYTASLRRAVATARGSDHGLGIVRLVDPDDASTSADAGHAWRRGEPRSLAETVRVLDGYDVVSLQHEFGIFGGADGEEVVELVSQLRTPVATTFHTVLAEPTSHQRAIVRRLARD